MSQTNQPEQPAVLLLQLLQRGPRTWKELAAAGLDRASALLAVGEVVDLGEHRVRVGPILLELEPREDVP